MKKLIILIPLILTITLCGCSSTENSKLNVIEEKSFSMLEDSNYKEALKFLELSEKGKTKNQDVPKLIKAIKEYQKSDKLYKNKDYEGAFSLVNKIDKIYEKYPSFKKDVNNLKKESYSLIADDKLKKAKISYESENYEDANKILSELDIELLSKSQKATKDKLDKYIKESSEESNNIQTETSNVETSSQKQIYLNKMQDIESKNTEIIKNTGNSESEILYSTNKIFHYRDDMLNEIWGVLKNTLPKNEMSTLTNTQLQWIKNRDSEASTMGSVDSIAYTSSLSEQTKTRCYELINGYMN